MLAQLDQAPGVERSFANHTGNMVRVAVASTADPEKVAERIAQVLTEQKRGPVRLRDAELRRAIDNEHWRAGERVRELSFIEYRTLAVRQLRLFAEREKLDKETAAKLMTITEEEWDRLGKEDGAKSRGPIDWRTRYGEAAAAVVERAKSVLSADQVGRLKDWAKDGRGR